MPRLDDLRVPAGARGWLRFGATAVAAALLAALGVVSLVRNAGWTEPDDGAVWKDFGGRVVLIDVSPEGPADRAGLRPGDFLESIDGRKVESAIAARSRLWQGRRDTPREYRVSRSGEDLSVRLIPDSRPRPNAALYPYLVIVGFFFLTTGTYAAFRLGRGRPVGSFTLLSFSLFAVLALSDTSRAETLDWVLFWADRAGRLLAPAAFLQYVIAFLRRGSRRRGIWLVPLAYLPAVLLGAANVVLIWLGRAASAVDPVGLLALRDRIELGYMGTCFAAGTAMLAVSYVTRTSRSHHRQIRWMMWGALVGLGPFSILYLAPVAMGLEPAPWAPVSALPLILLPLAFTSALLRYRLSDLELFLKRGTTTLSIAFFTLAAYAVLSILTDWTLGSWLDSQGIGAATLAALATAILYPRIRTVTRAAVDRLFYRGTYNFRRTLLAFGRELNSELDLDALVSKIERRARDTLELDRLSLYLADEEQGVFRRVGRSLDGPARIEAGDRLQRRLGEVSFLSADDLGAVCAEAADLSEAGLRTVFPMRVKGEIHAFLAVGTRSRGDFLNSEDVEMLVALSAQAASALEAARLLRKLSEKVEEVERLRRDKENILESSGVAILVIDGAGVVQNCNRSLEDLTGVPRTEALGRPIRELYPLPLVRGVEQLIARAETAAVDGPPRSYRARITNRAGERLRVNLAIAPLDASRAGAPGWVLTIDDVTEQVRLEERLLRQDRLAAIGLLASGVAHEVNTPLTGISSYAQMLLDETGPDDPRFDLLKQIERQTSRASSIANSLLNFSRGAADEAPMEKLDLAEVVNEALALVEPQFRVGEVRLVRDIEPGLPRVPGHRGKLQQVLLNLLLNARDALEGRGTVRLSLRRSGDSIILEVSDDGCGIEEENLGRIFDPFFTTKARGKGTGLGLALSYNIVREHRGEIFVESRPGEGTTFTVDLPLDRRAAGRG